MSFSELGLSAKVQAAVAAAGYTEPTPIQAQAIPHVLARRDVLGIAQTGTGKTAAFTLPMITMLEEGRARARMPRTLILEPTRELAAQVEDNFVKYGVNHKLSVALLIGGVSFGDQDAKLTRGVDVLIATPGRLLDHFERGRLLLTGVELLVIDEADRMLDMGFIPDIERICKMVPFTRQTLFFTATMPPEIQRITEQFLHNPIKVEVSRAASTATTITQRLVRSGKKDFEKRDTLRALVRGADSLKNAIIFCNRKSEVATVYKSLQKHEFSVAALHGDMDQSARTAALTAFRDGKTQLLVASDVAARGLDIPDVSHVFNYDTPHHAEDYVHRIGRTGRAGRLGTAITIVTPEDTKLLSAIEKLIGQPIEWAGDAISDEEASEAKRERRGAGGRSGRSSGGRGEPRGESRGEARSETRAEPRAAEERPARRSAEPRATTRAERPERAERPARQPEAPVSRDRGSARPPASEEADMSHMPQFLLRPVTYRGK
ncbi:MAG: DEAD/DEAH box helicase [Phreatobacter sp.]|uniref:DEAD/DEAH box helicase n=1 Tax=Phreatobacter sp. TaxID=1966341 RepID=UPI0027351F7C|nr:DEAD/DEAH box helicase [Phreatobacter sp.]MDP2803021.1 DEAD/DEAH box helicase [Phreatobacter sp.]